MHLNVIIRLCLFVCDLNVWFDCIMLLIGLTLILFSTIVKLFFNYNYLNDSTKTNYFFLISNIHLCFQACQLLTHGISSIISLAECSTNHFLSSYFMDYQLPFLSVTMTACHSQNNSDYHLRVHPSYLYEAIGDVINRDYWKQMMIIHDDTVGK